MRNLYIDYYYYITTSLPLNFFFILLTSYKTSQNIASIASMGTVFHYSYWNMDPLLRLFFPRDTINNTIHFLTSIPESTVEVTGVRL